MKTFRVKVNGKEYEVEIEETETAIDRIVSSSTPRTAQSAIASTPTTASATVQSSTDGKIVAPMPGTVLHLSCKNGQSVKKGDTLLILEAMKMENAIQAPADGEVKELKVSEGQSVDAGDLLVQLAI